jgi:hypothetical protein
MDAFEEKALSFYLNHRQNIKKYCAKNCVRAKLKQREYYYNMRMYDPIKYDQYKAKQRLYAQQYRNGKKKQPKFEDLPQEEQVKKAVDVYNKILENSKKQAQRLKTNNLEKTENNIL